MSVYCMSVSRYSINVCVSVSVFTCFVCVFKCAYVYMYVCASLVIVHVQCVSTVYRMSVVHQYSMPHRM